MSDQSGNDRNQRAAERQHDLVDDLEKRLTEASARDAQEAIKVALLVNSGAAVAILAFISTLASRSGITFTDLKAIMKSLYWFAGELFPPGLRLHLHTLLTATMLLTVSPKIKYGSIHMYGKIQDLDGCFDGESCSIGAALSWDG
jgi:hypothetical protein